MKRRFVIAACMALSLVAGGAAAQQPAKPAAKAEAISLQDLTKAKFTGDLDGMIKRRVIRVLVPFSKTLYTVDRGAQRGVTVDVGRLLEDDLNKKLQNKNIRLHVFFVNVDRDEIIPALLDGRGDVAMANLTITPERLEKVDFSNPTRRNVKELVVTGPGAPAIATKEDLSGQEVYVRKSSSFHASLEALNAELRKAGKPPVRIRAASEDLETEDILEMVNAGLVKITVVDDHVVDLWQQILPNLKREPEVALRSGGEIGWMIRKNSPQLKAELNAMLSRYPEGSARRNQLMTKYWKSTKFVKNATSKDELEKFERTIAFFRSYGDRYEMDYLLMIAQGYQESRLDQNAKSPVGAIGVMQVMPPTGADMKVGDIKQIEPNIHAGVKYMRFMMNNFYADAPMTPLNKGLFTFASYNAGPGRMNQLRREAEKRGLDPNVWFNNVERIAAEKIGRETVTYVSNIYKYYLAYQMLQEDRTEHGPAKKAAGGG